MADQSRKREASSGDAHDDYPAKRQKSEMSLFANPVLPVPNLKFSFKVPAPTTTKKGVDDDPNDADYVDKPKSKPKLSAAERLPIGPQRLHLPRQPTLQQATDEIFSKTYKLRSRDTKDPPATTATTCNHPDLVYRMQRLEASHKSLESSVDKIRSIEPRATRRELNNLATLERQANAMETRLHDLEARFRDMKTTFEAMPSHPQNNPNRLDTIIATGELPTKEVTEPPAPAPQKHDGDNDDVVFLGQRTKNSTTPSSEGPPQPEVVKRDNFVAYLKSLDFQSPEGMNSHANTPVILKEYTLCILDNGTTYFVRLGTEDTCLSDMEFEEDPPAPLVLPRENRGYRDLNEDADTTSLNCCCDFIVEIEYRGLPFGLNGFGSSPRYAYLLGEIYVRKPGVNGMPPRTFSTNYFLLMDVIHPQRPLWIAYAYEYIAEKVNTTNGATSSTNPGGSGGTNRVLTMYDLKRDEEFCKGFGIFDMARIADGLDSFKQANETSLPQLDPSDVEKTLRASARTERPVFTQPNLADLTVALSQTLYYG
ncbi:uncharacterized protein F4822DRAFT_415034 [Hypoxylon trugodes]|uniref:uncharacterized protein n=1 Tax=Hypoxylon trugodes TaxID=326681 RepID=UPI002199DA3E|nr:uncharacterized protein F4822DRAFT_415034 [Hypoxylon trugodes]KAI1384403.1 hypothetical protein F4822DRAFT_415034 [Hypoxylon trugodes]